MSEPTKGSGGMATGLAITAILAVIALALSLVGLVADDDDGADGGGGGALTVDVTLIDGEGGMSIDPSVIEVEAGTRLTVNVTNDGEFPHDFVLGGEVGTAMLDPGATETVDLGVIESSTVAWCTVPGHRDAGMETRIEVIGDSGGDGGHMASGGEGAVIDFTADAPEGFEPRDPTAPVAADATVHDVTFTIEELQYEVAPGVVQEAWTFNGTVPGPTLRGKVGDVFNIHLVNPADSVVSHSVDFHASKVAWDDEMRSIAPGEQLTYTFEATAAGFFMYHCGTGPTLHHIGNGMFGGVIIDPPSLPPVDQEFVIIQSEIYTGPQGEVASLAKMIEDDWDAVVFNGYVNQYKYAPIRVEVGEHVRVWVLDTGPSENASFHIVGTIFDTVYKEGAYRLRPGPDLGGAQALDLQPAQGGFVEFTFAEEGLYPIVTHKFSNVGKGALGLFQAGELPDREDDGRVSAIDG